MYSSSISGSAQKLVVCAPRQPSSNQAEIKKGPSALEKDVEHHAEARNREVHPMPHRGVSKRVLTASFPGKNMRTRHAPLHRVQARRIRALEEPARRDERARERRDALEALTKVEPRGSVLRRAEHRDVRVRGDLERRQAAPCGQITSRASDLSRNCRRESAPGRRPEGGIAHR